LTTVLSILLDFYLTTPSDESPEEKEEVKQLIQQIYLHKSLPSVLQIKEEPKVQKSKKAANYKPKHEYKLTRPIQMVIPLSFLYSDEESVRAQLISDYIIASNEANGWVPCHIKVCPAKGDSQFAVA